MGRSRGHSPDILGTSRGVSQDQRGISGLLRPADTEQIRSRYGADPPELPGILNDSRYEFIIYDKTIERLRYYL